MRSLSFNAVKTKLLNQFKKRNNHAPVPSKALFWCDWPWSTLVVLCDGVVVCGCADPRGQRPVGDLTHQTLEEIWHGVVMQNIRQGLMNRNPQFCQNCGMKREIPECDFPQNPPEISPLPSRLFIEPTIHCNISCYRSHCNRASGIISTRRTPRLSVELFREIMEQSGPQLARLELFNYGEPFLHSQLPEMIRYVRQTFPQVFTFTSTNGTVWHHTGQLRSVIESGLHELVFSVDGASEEVYSRYRCGGDFSRVISNIEQMVQLRDEMGAKYPIITMRYILFRWNDSDQEMDKARSLARQLDVDRLCWEITDHPEGCPSERFVPGTPDYDNIRFEIWDVGANANALIEKRPQACIEPQIHGITAMRGEDVTFEVKIKNTGHSLWFATSPDNLRFVTLGIQLRNEDEQLINRDFHRVLLPLNMHPQQEISLPITLRVPSSVGEYFLTFDMVLEGYGWFESGGSPTVQIPMYVMDSDV